MAEIQCVVCGGPLGAGTVRGMGDGSGQRFAHEGCYWRHDAQRLRRAASDLVEAWEHQAGAPRASRDVVRAINALRSTLAGRDLSL